LIALRIGFLLATPTCKEGASRPKWTWVYAQFFMKILFFCMTIFLLFSQVYAEWQDRLGPAKQVNLNEILRHPETWMNVPVEIPVRFAWLSDVYIPFRTHFSQDRFVNFAAWDIQEPIWEQQGFNNPHFYFYVEKDNPELKSFLKLQTFDTVCLLGKIEGMFAGKPFIRIVWCCRLPGSLDEIKLKAIRTSLTLYRQRRFDEALNIFEQILTSKPPQDIESMLRKGIAQVYMNERNSFEYAFVELKKAEEATPQDPEVQSLLLECTQKLGQRANVLLEAWQDGLLKDARIPANENNATITLPTDIDPNTGLPFGQQPVSTQPVPTSIPESTSVIIE